jgi:hypothetical protein
MAGFAVLLLPILAAAAPRTALLLPTTGSNVPEGQLAAAGDVLRAHLEATGRIVVIRAPAATASVELSPGQAGEAARRAGAPLAVALHVSRLGATGMARVGLYAQDGALLHADQLSVLGPDDLDPALQRLAEGIVRDASARDLARIDTVTAREELPLRKRPAHVAAGLALGAIVPLNRPEPGREIASAGGLGLVLSYDARGWIADVSLEGFTSSLDPDDDPDRGLALGMGVYLPFSKADAAPYLGVQVAWAAVHFAGEGASGIQARGVGGLLLGRLSSVSARLQVGYFVDAFPIRAPDTGKDVYVRGAIASLVLVAAPRG